MWKQARRSKSSKTTALWRRSSRFRVGGNGCPQQRSAVNSCGWDQIPRPVCGIAGNSHRDDGRSTLVIPQRALADTSVFIGLEGDGSTQSFREFRVGCLRDNAGGVAGPRAASSESRGRLPQAVDRPAAQRLEALAVDEGVEVWVLLISRLRAAGRKAPINDSWIAATAIAHGVLIVTQDSDYDGIPDLEVIRI